MKNFFIALFLLAFASSSFASVVVGYVDKETSFVISDKRAVITQGKKKYICEFKKRFDSEIDNDGLVFESNMYQCDARIFFFAKHFLKTDLWQLRLYNAKREYFLYDGYLKFSDFSIISKV